MEAIKTNPISDWPYEDQPRFKLGKHGSFYLTNTELLSILINTGNKDSSAIDLAKQLLQLAGNNLNELGKLSLDDIRKVKGMGFSKASTIIAAIELGRRNQCASPIQRVTVRRSDDIAEYLKTMFKDLTYEIFAVIFLNRANKIKHFEILSKGGWTGTVSDPRIILRKALEHQATSLVLCHNHPSGNLNPSNADEEITKKIKMAAQYLDIKVLDHLIVSDEGYFSFAEQGLI